MKSKDKLWNLDDVRAFLLSGGFPQGYTNAKKSAVRRRAKQFVLINGDVFFIAGRCKSNKQALDELENVENPEDEPDHTQVLRRVLFSKEEQVEAVAKAHVSGQQGKLS